MYWIAALVLELYPLLFFHPLNENVTALQGQPLLYWPWILSTLFWMVWPWRKTLKPTELCISALALLAAACIPWSSQGPGWKNDLHVWLQVGAVGLYVYNWFQNRFQNYKAFQGLLVTIALSLAVMAASGHVCGLGECLFGAGLVLNAKKASRRMPA